MGSGYELTEVAGYRLAERIGSGGMGEVYKAYNHSLNRYAAVKILSQINFSDRFRNEAYIQSSINHPNIARLYEFTQLGDKQCIVMEYVEGESLDTLLHRKGKFSNEETENILRQIVDALSYLHKKDIMHRDIKPQNFKVQPDGTVKMLDFGIAKHKYSPKLTQVGFVVGTMEYLAPEQFQQQEGMKSDIWALAVMTYELLTGYMPFESTNPVALQTKIRKGNFTNPRILIPDISDKLLNIIDKSLKVNPAQRISAAGIETLLGKKRITTISRIGSLKLPSQRVLLIMLSVIVILAASFLITRSDTVKSTDIPPVTDNPADSQVSKENIKTAVADNKGKVLINTPGISDAEIISDNGEKKSLPYSVEGNEGDRFQFTIHANGYQDKKIEVQITPRRSSFDYNLEKINN